jgi:hypothetical protein
MGFKWLQPAKVQVVKIFDDVYGVLLAKTVDLFFTKNWLFSSLYQKLDLIPTKMRMNRGFNCERCDFTPAFVYMGI